MSKKGGKREGAGRPSGVKPTAVTVSITLPRDTYDRMESLRESRKQSRSATITQAIELLLTTAAIRGEV